MRYRLRNVRVRVPRRTRPRTPAYATIDRGRINYQTIGSTRALLAREYNRKRREENKVGSRRRKSSGAIFGVRTDKHGIVAAAVRAGLSAQRIEDAALVAQAYGG